MTRQEITEKLIKTIKENVDGFQDIDMDENTVINSDTSINSMNFMFIMCKVENEFGIDIPSKKWDKMQTLGDATDAVEKALKKKKKK